VERSAAEMLVMQTLVLAGFKSAGRYEEFVFLHLMHSKLRALSCAADFICGASSGCVGERLRWLLQFPFNCNPCNPRHSCGLELFVFLHEFAENVNM